MLVHIGGASTSILLAIDDNLEQFMLIIDIPFCETFNVAPLLLALSQLQIILRNIQKVSHLLHVQFENRDFYFVLD